MLEAFVQEQLEGTHGATRTGVAEVAEASASLGTVQELAADSDQQEVQGEQTRHALAPPPPPAECGECELECMRPRPLRCKHKCPWPCHFEPCPPCFEDVVLKCYCGQSLLTYACCEVLSWPDVEGKDVENPFLRCPMPCHRTHAGCPHMCVAKCHFGPCPPCGRQNVTAKCRCGTLRRQLPCSEVWIGGKQLVLDCMDGCKAAAAATGTAADATGSAEVETDGSVQAAAADPAELRDRRREKRRKRDEELEERRQREEAAKRWRAMVRRARCFAVLAGVVLFLVLLCCAVAELRRRNLASREELRRPRRVAR